jgi:hypothetical protein
MSPKQILDEIFRDYEFNLEAGMTSRQSLDVLKAMLMDALEAEYSRGHSIGEKSGRHGAQLEKLLGIQAHQGE